MNTFDEYIHKVREERLKAETTNSDLFKNFQILSDSGLMALFTYQHEGDIIIGARELIADLRYMTGNIPKMFGQVAEKREEMQEYAELATYHALKNRRELMAFFPEIMCHPLYDILQEDLMFNEEEDKNEVLEENLEEKNSPDSISNEVNGEDSF